MEDRIKEIELTCEKYGFLDRKVRPYSFDIKVKDLIDGWKGYSKCTRSSQQVIEAEIRGFEDILDAWIKFEEEPMVLVKLIDGKLKGEMKEYHKSLAESIIEAGLGEAVAAPVEA